MKTLLTASLLLTTGLAAAQYNGGAGAVPAVAPTASATPAHPGEIRKLDRDIRADERAIRDDRLAIHQSFFAEHAQLKDLDSREEAAINAARTDPLLSPRQKRERVALLRADFKVRRTGAETSYEDQRRRDRAAIRDERQDIRVERRERRDIEHGK